MNTHGVRTLVQYLEDNCRTTITPKQSEQLREMKSATEYNICRFRKLYRIALANHVYPECPYCHKPIVTQEDLTIDHIIPRSKGGKDDVENLQPMHKACNSEKGCTVPETTKCDEVPIKKYRRNHHKPKNKERDIVKSRTPEELYKKCKKIDQARTNKLHAKLNNHGR